MEFEGAVYESIWVPGGYMCYFHEHELQQFAEQALQELCELKSEILRLEGLNSQLINANSRQRGLLEETLDLTDGDLFDYLNIGWSLVDDRGMDLLV